MLGNTIWKTRFGSESRQDMEDVSVAAISTGWEKLIMGKT